MDKFEKVMVAVLGNGLFVVTKEAYTALIQLGIEMQVKKIHRGHPQSLNQSTVEGGTMSDTTSEGMGPMYCIDCGIILPDGCTFINDEGPYCNKCYIKVGSFRVQS